jgi:hypothetical protein
MIPIVPGDLTICVDETNLNSDLHLFDDTHFWSSESIAGEVRPSCVGLVVALRAQQFGHHAIYVVSETIIGWDAFEGRWTKV